MSQPHHESKSKFLYQGLGLHLHRVAIIVAEPDADAGMVTTGTPVLVLSALTLAASKIVDVVAPI